MIKSHHLYLYGLVVITANFRNLKNNAKFKIAKIWVIIIGNLSEHVVARLRQNLFLTKLLFL